MQLLLETLLKPEYLHNAVAVGVSSKGRRSGSGIVQSLESDQQDQPVELGFPLRYALSWDFPPTCSILIDAKFYFTIFLIVCQLLL